MHLPEVVESLSCAMPLPLESAFLVAVSIRVIPKVADLPVDEMLCPRPGRGLGTLWFYRAGFRVRRRRITCFKKGLTVFRNLDLPASKLL